jgi:hypothetical protein
VIAVKNHLEKPISTMSQIDKSALEKLLTDGPNRSLVGGKQLTLAFAGVYIASTTLKAKPLLVWETQSGYPRYYVPIESLHEDIKSQLGYSQDSNANGSQGSGKDIKLEVIDSVQGKSTDSKALIEKLTIGSRSSTWTRFVEGPLMGFVRFERKEIGMPSSISIDVVAKDTIFPNHEPSDCTRCFR